MRITPPRSILVYAVVPPSRLQLTTQQPAQGVPVGAACSSPQTLARGSRRSQDRGGASKKARGTEAEVSEALPPPEGDSIGSPSFFNRSVETSLALRHGGSVVIGGPMFSRDINSDSGLPFIKKSAQC